MSLRSTQDKNICGAESFQRVHMDRIERIFMLECRLRAKSKSRNTLKDLRFMASWEYMVVYEVSNRGRENEFRKGEKA